MSTNWLLIFVLIILVVVSVFVPQISNIGEFGIETSLPESPSVWDVLTFTAGWIWDCMTFSIPGMPWWIGTIFWVINFIWIYCVFRLVRGTS